MPTAAQNFLEAGGKTSLLFLLAEDGLENLCVAFAASVMEERRVDAEDEETKGREEEGRKKRESVGSAAPAARLDGSGGMCQIARISGQSFSTYWAVVRRKILDVRSHIWARIGGCILH